MEGEKLTSAVAATGNFVDRLDPQDRVQLYAFDQNLRTFGPVADVATVRDGLFAGAEPAGSPAATRP